MKLTAKETHILLTLIVRNWKKAFFSAINFFFLRINQVSEMQSILLFWFDFVY